MPVTHRRAVLLLLLTALLWSFGGVLIKRIDWNPLAIAGTRSLIAWPLIWIAVRRAGPFAWSTGHLAGGGWRTAPR